MDNDVAFLWQPTRAFRLTEPSCDARFSDVACAGIEECLPTVAACSLNGEKIPDHGDFWQLVWKTLPATELNTIRLQADGFTRPLRFHKQYRLQENSLDIACQIENTSEAPVPFHYAAHPLLAIDAGDQIELPAEITSLRLYDSRQNRLGIAGDRVQWPLAKRSVAQSSDGDKIVAILQNCY